MSRVESFPADSFLAASGSGLHLLRRWPLPPPKEGGAPPPPAPRGCGEPAFDEVAVSHDAEYTAAEWNRNDRVVAAGSADGTVQLRYACGTMMYMLPREGAAPYGGAITALSWSAGSKRLAAGCATGDVHIHDIQTKSTTTLGGHLGGVTAVRYQHEDRFLAVASNGGSVVLYPDPHRGGAGAATAVPLRASAGDASARLCLALSAGDDALVAAGSARGGVAVWDVPTCRLQEEYVGQHGSERVNALSFVPLKAGWIYSAGGDGRVCLQDRMVGRGHVSVINAGAPCTALMVREDHALVGVGTADGVVKLYDPRNSRQPLHTVCLPAGQPVTALHWQHRFASLAARHHSRAPTHASDSRGGASKLAQHKQQPTPADTHTHKIKAAAAAAAESAVAELQPTSLGSFQPWTISAVPGGELASGSSSDEVPAAAARLQPSGSGEFSFAAAQRSAEQLAAGGAVWAAGCQAAGEVAGGGAAAAAALQDNLLAMHLDMLSQFQEQQACMGKLVGQVMQQNEALNAKVAALEHRLAAATTRRENFLWL
ncbi:WD40 repeat [Micractinium conductrix]|uniref:WD40 repeat n=1 Tax=Micractinium conductrix TaxID=554055 RepID=A0A2P6VRZ2_9CHLO|nr:WD40 repeat [Micractinium conductrix]|eukprot:PSC76845.1 WD40 repeat [Micractinium conductrix]